MRGTYGLEVVSDCDACPLARGGRFCELSSRGAARFNSVQFKSVHPAGDVLFLEGQASRGVYLLCRGRVKLTMNSEDGKTLIVRIGEPGEILGLHAALSGEPYELTAEALQACQVNFVGREDFLQLLREYPEASGAIIRQLSEVYRLACREIRYLGLSRSASERVARFLLEAASQAQATSQGRPFRLGLTHEEISQMVGISRETVTRTLSEFKSKMLIATNGSTVVIRSESGLRALAAAA